MNFFKMSFLLIDGYLFESLATIMVLKYMMLGTYQGNLHVNNVNYKLKGNNIYDENCLLITL